MILLALLAAASPGPVYLACVFPRKTEPAMLVDVSLDEGNQRAIIAMRTGRVVTRPALFSPDKVQVPDEESTWTISRVDLGIVRTVSFMPPDDPGESGTCQIKPAPAARAF